MRIRLAIGVATAVLCAGFLAACGSSGPQLAGRTFLSVGVTENGAPRALVAGTRITLDFRQDGITASAGCNTMAGPYEIQGGRLVVGVTSMTAMGCDPARADQDAWLSQVLGARPAVTLAGDGLTIDAGVTVIQLRDRRVVEPDLALVGPTWTLDTIFSGDVASSVPAGVTATLVFHADGTLDVDTGCNKGSARWKAVGSGIEVTQLGLTKRGCPGPEGGVEAAVVATLGASAITASIEATRLLLHAGAAGLAFRGAP